MPSMRKLAELAGFSVATVSRALNGDPHTTPFGVDAVQRAGEESNHPEEIAQASVWRRRQTATAYAKAIR